MGSSIKTQGERGMSMVEVMISAFIIMVALLGFAMTMVQGISAVYFTQEQLIAKQKAREALESVFTARSTQNITFNQIQNDNIPGGLFLVGFQAVRGMGIDGIANTADDAATNIEALTLPGNDGVLGTADDQTLPLTNYQRKLTVGNVLDTDGNVDPDIRRIDSEVRFKTNNVWRSVTVNSFVSRFQ
jgi:type II secretory pathway pseudopilin PulG